MKRRFLIPEVIQSSAMDCGPASLKSLLEGFGISASYGRLREACQTDVDGTSIDKLEEAGVQLGLDAAQVMLPVDHLFLEEAEALCTRIAMLKAGHVVALDTTRNMLSRAPGLTVRLAAARLPDAWRSRVLRHEAGLFYLSLGTYADLERLLASLRENEIAIDELALTETDLEEVFLKIMAGSEAVNTERPSPELPEASSL